MLRFSMFAALPLAAALVFGCGGDDDSPDPTATADETTTVTSTAGAGETPAASATAPGETPTAPETPFEGNVVPVTATAEPDLETPVLVDVRAASHPGFDRIAFEFEGDGPPGYSVQYVDQAIACGSGHNRTNDLGDGTAPQAILQVQILPAAAHNQGGTATAPLKVEPNLSALRTALLTCDFEADVTYHLALTAVQPFAVSVLENPPRLVVDIGNDE